MSNSNRKTLNTGFTDTLRGGRKLVRYALMAAVACGGLWIVVESAHALSKF